MEKSEIWLVKESGRGLRRWLVEKRGEIWLAKKVEEDWECDWWRKEVEKVKYDWLKKVKEDWWGGKIIGILLNISWVYIKNIKV